MWGLTWPIFCATYTRSYRGEAHGDNTTLFWLSHGLDQHARRNRAKINKQLKCSALVLTGNDTLVEVAGRKIMVILFMDEVTNIYIYVNGGSFFKTHRSFQDFCGHYQKHLTKLRIGL